MREIAALEISGETTSGRINPSGTIRRSLRKPKMISQDFAINKRKYYSKTEEIDDSEISRRKAANE